MTMRVREVPIGDVVPYEGNPRDNEAAVPAVAESLREFGWRQPIVVDADMTVVCGHTRLKAARHLGMETVPVVVADDLTAEQVAAYRLADNRTAELAEWDAGLLALELDGLAGFDMGRFGFDESDAAVDGDPLESVAEDAAPEVEDAPTRVKRGEVWLLGRHRLLCGDATDPADTARLAGGGVADLLLTDPPYNVAVGSHDGEAERAVRRMRGDGALIANDDWHGDDEGFRAFLASAFKAAMGVTAPGAAFYVWHADSMRGDFLEACARAEMRVRQVVVWVKGTFTLGRQDYQWRHEPCLYGWKDGAAHHFRDSRRESTVIEDGAPDIEHMTKAELRAALEEVWSDKVATTVARCEKPARSEQHPTMKPVRLMAYLMANSTEPGQTVLDPFCGSGTTLVAAEQLGRTCWAMELDPRCCDVILERWERLTGRTAVRED